MKRLLIVLTTVGLTAAVCFADDKLVIKYQNDRDSYSLGYQYGEILKKQDWVVNPDLFVHGFRAGLGGGKPAMSSEEIQESLVTIRKRMAAAQHKKMQEQSTKNYEAGKAFLEQNSKNEGVKSLPSGLQYKIITEGSGRAPGPADSVTVNYRGTFIDGTEFDNSYKKGKPETLQVSGVIPGWTEALQLMKEGSKWQLFVPPELAYGEAGQGSRIPRNSVLIFEIDLLRIEDSAMKMTR